MPTPYLHGNCEPCDACALRRERDAHKIKRPPIPCNHCDGKGYIALDATEIIRRSCEDNLRNHWAAFDQRICGQV